MGKIGKNQVPKPLKIKHRGDVIRTRGLYVPNVALYQTEPHLDWLLTKQRYYALAPDKSQAKTPRMQKSEQFRAMSGVQGANGAKSLKIRPQIGKIMLEMQAPAC